MIPRNEIIPALVVCVIGVAIVKLTDQPAFRDIHPIPLTFGLFLLLGVINLMSTYFLNAQIRGGTKGLVKAGFKFFLVFVVAVIFLSLVFPEFR